MKPHLLKTVTIMILVAYFFILIKVYSKAQKMLTLRQIPQIEMKMCNTVV